MSKSATGANHAVALLDPPDKIRKTIMRATTDSNPAVDFDGAGRRRRQPAVHLPGILRRDRRRDARRSSPACAMAT